MPTIEDYTDLILRLAGSPQGKAPNFDDHVSNQRVDVSWLKTNPLNARRSIVDVEAMADSIAHHDQLETIVVTRGDDGFALIDSGHRRFLGRLLHIDRLMTAGVTITAEMRSVEIKVIDRFSDEVETAVRMLVYNLDREDLDPLDEAAEYHRLLSAGQLTEAALAQKVGGKATEQRIRNRLNLLNLADGSNGPRVLQHYREGRISTSAAEQIGRLPLELQGEFARRVLVGDINGNELQRSVTEAIREHQIAQLTTPTETNGSSSLARGPLDVTRPAPLAPTPRVSHPPVNSNGSGNGSAYGQSTDRPGLTMTKLHLRPQPPSELAARSERKQFEVSIAGAKVIITVNKHLGTELGSVAKVNIEIARADGGAITDDSIAPLLVAFAGGSMPREKALAYFERQVERLRTPVVA